MTRYLVKVHSVGQDGEAELDTPPTEPNMRWVPHIVSAVQLGPVLEAGPYSRGTTLGASRTVTVVWRSEPFTPLSSRDPWVDP